MKITIRIWALLIALLTISSLQAQDSKPKSFTLKEAIDFARFNNQNLRNAKLEELLAKKKVKEIVSMGLPQITAKGEFMHYFTIPTTALPDFISPVVFGNLVGYGLIPPTTPGPPSAIVPAQFGVKNNLTVSASASWLLFDGGYFMGIKASSEYVNLAKLSTKQTDVEVELNVRKAYYQVLLLDVNLESLNVTLKMLEKTSYDLNETAKAGLMEKNDADRLRLQLSTVKLNYDRLKDARSIAYQALKIQMGLETTDSLALTDNLKALTASEGSGMELANVDFSKRIEYLILEQQKKLNRLDQRRWQLGYAPSLVAFGQIQRNTFAQDFSEIGNRWFAGSLAGLTLNVPVFDGLMKASKIQQNKINDRKIENGRKLLSQGIELERQAARTKYLRAKEQLKIQEENLKLAQTILSNSELKLKNGVGSTLELTTSQNDFIGAQSAYLNTLYDILVAEAELNRANGN